MTDPLMDSAPDSAADIILVVAAADNGVIGDRGRIPWHLPADLRRFRALTMGHALLMGRKTFDSIGRPLPGRRNIVLTRQPGWAAAGVETAADLPTALRLAMESRAMEGGAALMVIGGAELYAEARPLAHRIELTRVHLLPAGDAFFAAPEPALWRRTSAVRHEAEGEAPAHSFETYARVSAPKTAMRVGAPNMHARVSALAGRP